MKALFLALSLLLPLCFSVASAQLTKLTVGYSAIAAGHFPAWMAKEAGIFSKNGLDVQLVYFRGGTPAMMALLSRETPISQLGGPAIVSASLRGSDAVLIAGGLVLTEWWLMTRADIKTAEKLKGGSVAISVFGGVGRLFDPHRLTKARADSGEGCRNDPDERYPGATECVGGRKGSGGHASETRQLRCPEKGIL